MNIEDVRDASPPTPACFSDRSQWAAYLHQCQGGRPRQAPFRDGIYRPIFNFCKDCTPEHARAQTGKGRCRPQQFHAVAETA